MYYQFIKVTTFSERSKEYYMSEKLHTENSIQTIGKICYEDGKIFLVSLRDEKKTPLNIINEKMPEDGTYVNLFGMFSFFSDSGLSKRYNFENSDDNEDFIPILNVEFWNDIEGLPQAEMLEEIFYDLFKDE